MEKFNGKVQGRGYFRKTKAFGLASGIILGTILFFGIGTASADEVTAPNTPATTVTAEAPKQESPAQPTGSEVTPEVETNAQPVVASGVEAPAARKEVAELVNTQKPSDQPDADGTYNSQISKISIIEKEANGKSARVKIDLADGYSIPTGGKITFKVDGDVRPETSTLLNENKETVGEISSTIPVAKDSTLNSQTTLEGYKKVLNNSPVEQLIGSKTFELRFKEPFAKLNKNRSIEFTLKSEKNAVNRKVFFLKDEDTKVQFFESPDKSTFDSKIYLASDPSKFIKGPKTFATVTTNKFQKVKESVQVVTPNGYTSGELSAKNNPEVSRIYYDYPDGIRDTAEIDSVIKKGEAVSPIAEQGNVFTLTTPENSLISFTGYNKFKKGDETTLSIVERSSLRNAVPGKQVFTDTDALVHGDISKGTTADDVRVRILESTPNKFSFELLEGIDSKEGYRTTISNFNLVFMYLKPENSTELSGVVGPEEYLKNIKDKSVTSFSPSNEKAIGLTYTAKLANETITKSTNNVTIYKNTNISYGEGTLGSLKVRYVDESGVEIPGNPTETLAENKPWDTIVTITPKNIDKYTFVKADSPLKTIVGDGKKVVTLTYKLGELPKEEIPITEETITNYTPDPNLNPGEQQVEKPGKPKKTQGDKVVDPGEPKVVRVGTKPKVTEEEVPFNKVTRDNPQLPEGETKVVQVGKVGKKKTTTTYTLDPKTGKVTPNEPTVETTPPVDEITEVGKGKDKDGDLKITYIPDPESPEGTETVVDQGKKPKYDVTGKEKDPGKPKVVKIGTKPKVTEEEIPFNKVTKENPQLPEGESKVVQVGKVGKKTTTTTYTLDPKTGKVTPNEPTVETTPPVDEITEIGKGKDKDGDLKITYIPDPESPEGTETVVDQGKKPKYDVTGKEKDPGKPKVVKIGTKPKVTEEEIPFKEVTVENPSKPEGYREVLKKGKVGKKTTTVTYTLDAKTGKVTPNEPTVAIVKAEDELVEVGVGKNINGEIVTQYVPDIELEFGKTKIVQNGTPEVKDVTGKVVTPGTPTIIHIGIKPKVEEEDVEFKVVKRDNPELPKGQEKVVQEGKVGKKKTTTTYEVDPKTGKVTSKTTEEVDKPTDKIIEVGTKEEAKVTPAPETPKTPTQTPAPKEAPKAQLPNTGEKASSALMVAGLAVAAMTVGFVAKGRKEEN